MFLRRGKAVKPFYFEIGTTLKLRLSKNAKYTVETLGERTLEIKTPKSKQESRV